MNRQQRRQAQKLNKRTWSTAEVVSRVGAAYKHSLREDTQKLTAKVVNDVDAATVLALHDKFGFGKDRLNKFRRERDKALEAILEGYVTAEDVLMVMEEEIYRGKVPKLEDIL